MRGSRRTAKLLDRSKAALSKARQGTCNVLCTYRAFQRPERIKRERKKQENQAGNSPERAVVKGGNPFGSHGRVPSCYHAALAPFFYSRAPAKSPKGVATPAPWLEVTCFGKGSSARQSALNSALLYATRLCPCSRNDLAAALPPIAVAAAMSDGACDNDVLPLPPSAPLLDWKRFHRCRRKQCRYATPRRTAQRAARRHTQS